MKIDILRKYKVKTNLNNVQMELSPHNYFVEKNHYFCPQKKCNIILIWNLKQARLQGFCKER